MEKKQEEWRVLCEQIAKEHDPQRFMELIHELNGILAEKELLQGCKKSRAERT